MRQKPRPLHRRPNSSSGSARREQSPRSVDLGRSHPKSPGGRAPRDTGRRPVNAGSQRGPPSWPGSRSWQIQARALLPIRTDGDLPAAGIPPHCCSRGSCSPSHTRIHRQPVRHTLGAEAEAPPGLYLVGPASPRVTSWACAGHSPGKWRGLSLAPPPSRGRTHHTWAPAQPAPEQVTQPCVN